MSGGPAVPAVDGGLRRRAWRLAVRSLRAQGRLTAHLRAQPDFLIIGAQRSGTTSLHHYLARNPAVFAVRMAKGTHYFDVRFADGWNWYLGNFPTRAQLQRIARRTGTRPVVGEASPYYLFHPLAPQRIAGALPAVRLIAVLREPGQRAWSHYHHEVARGFETRPFEQAIDEEPATVADEEERLANDPGYRAFAHQHHSYLARGHYADQLERLFTLVPRDRVLVVSSADLGRDTQGVVDRVAGFLGVPPAALGTAPQHNARTYEPLPQRLRARLDEHFAPHNRRLVALLGADWGWST